MEQRTRPRVRRSKRQQHARAARPNSSRERTQAALSSLPVRNVVEAARSLASLARLPSQQRTSRCAACRAVSRTHSSQQAMALPTTMQRVLVTAFNPADPTSTLRCETGAPVPKPQAGEVLVRVTARPVNPADVFSIMVRARWDACELLRWDACELVRAGLPARWLQPACESTRPWTAARSPAQRACVPPRGLTAVCRCCGRTERCCRVFASLLRSH